MHRCVCHKVKDMGFFFRPQVSEMNKYRSLEMGVRFAGLLYMDEDLCIYRS